MEISYEKQPPNQAPQKRSHFRTFSDKIGTKSVVQDPICAKRTHFYLGLLVASKRSGDGSLWTLDRFDKTNPIRTTIL